jgi:hypothetical protein
MSEPVLPSDTPIDTVDVDIRAWVERARADPQLYRDRHQGTALKDQALL